MLQTILKIRRIILHITIKFVGIFKSFEMISMQCIYMVTAASGIMSKIRQNMTYNENLIRSMGEFTETSRKLPSRSPICFNNV